ncbi:hypothetical protein OAF54_02725 [bacterium]|nr:hypothetical protein [bacterium]
MYSPARKPSDWFQSDWAEVWLNREDGWEAKIFELVGFDPLRSREIRENCTILEIATAWKSMKALSDFVWNDSEA